MSSYTEKYNAAWDAGYHLREAAVAMIEADNMELSRMIQMIADIADSYTAEMQKASDAEFEADMKALSREYEREAMI